MDDEQLRQLLEHHSGQLLILALTVLLFGTLIVLVPQLLRTHLRKVEMQHLEQLRALERGVALKTIGERARAAGRTALLVPIVVLCAAGTVTCFLVATRSDSLVPVALTVWSVGGLVSLAAVTGGVALIGRLEQLSARQDRAEDHLSK
jgi:hypothetical protein